MIPCPICGLPEDPDYMNFHLIAGHGFAGGIPAPASTTDRSASQTLPRATDGGRGASESASVSTGRGPEKGSQRSPGGPREPKPVDPVIQAAEPAKADRDAAMAFYRTRIAVKKDAPAALNKDEFFKLVDACKAFGMEGTWKEARDWMKGLTNDGGDAAMGKLAKVFAQAGFQKLEGAEPKERALNPVGKAILSALEADHDGNTKGMSLDDLIARAAPGATQTHIDDLVDAGLVYEPLPGRWRRNKQGAK